MMPETLFFWLSENYAGIWGSAVHDGFVAEKADLGIVLHVDAFAFAQFGLAGGEQGAIVHGRLRFPSGYSMAGFIGWTTLHPAMRASQAY
jgi:hypothetical protein